MKRIHASILTRQNWLFVQKALLCTTKNLCKSLTFFFLAVWKPFIKKFHCNFLKHFGMIWIPLVTLVYLKYNHLTVIASLHPIDRIEYDVIVQISDLQHGVWARVRACRNQTRECCVLRVWTRIQFALQDVDFHSKKGVFQYGLYLSVFKKN